MESGAREMISELEKRNVQVCEFAYPAPNRHRHSVIKGLQYLIGLPALFARVLLSSRQFDVLHLTILYRHFSYPECALVLGARALRRPVLLNLRPGDWWLHYQQRSLLYRFFFRTTVRLSQRVAIESFDLMEPMRSLGVEPIYIPSFVTEQPRKRTESESQSTTIKLVYLGALNDAKGLAIVLEARRHLQKSGLIGELKVVGAGDPAYEKAMRDTYDEPEVKWLGEIPHQRVRRTISDSHFFLFPTTFIGEGHSNALNECMAEGIVPVVSDHGANRNVVDSAGVVLDVGASASEYAAAIESVWNSGEWLGRSMDCSSIMAKRFYAPVVMARLLKAYQEITLEE
jgi:glycosyltransferase involved in cell wall biosynthesis